jgi:1-acyl-sn-glycerol-3-phosphate acyltransferase
VGNLAARYGTMFVERGNPQSGANALRKAVRRLAGGASVLNFPEGTTTCEAPGRFQSGVFGLSRLVGVPVVPICIRFEDPALCWVDEQTLVPHYLKSLRNKPHTVHIEFGRPMPAKHHRSNESHAEAARVWIRGRFMC